MKFKIISIFFIVLISFNTLSYGIYSVIPIWSEMSDTTEVNAETADNFLNIESESVILIEATTRKNFIRKKLT